MASWPARQIQQQSLDVVSTQSAPAPSRTPSNPATGPISWPPNATRPLSDIREITEPSLMDMSSRFAPNQSRSKQHGARLGSVRHKEPKKQYGSMKRSESTRSHSLPKRSASSGVRRVAPGVDEYDPRYDAISSSSYSPSPEQASCYAVPLSSVPRRSSSFGHSRRASRDKPLKPPADALYSIPNRGLGRSPVKDARLRLDSVTAGVAHEVPSRTFMRCPHPMEIVDSPSYKHPRASAPISVGGGTVEGFVKVTVDDNERLKQRRTLGIGTISIDLLGYEEVSGGRKASFLALGSELVDSRHAPPPNMVEPTNPLTPGDKFWTTSPSMSALPFLISLPLDTGPPPFSSKYASIRFMLCATALIRDGCAHYRVRTSQEIQILPTYDPEKALTSLANPLTATDEMVLPRTNGFERIKLTAGLHRQVWVSGSTLFVDLYVLNKTHKHVKRLDLNLERDILCYKHAAAATRERSANQARVFESNHHSVIATDTLRIGSSGWSGIEPHASETRTCVLELPRGHATVKCGKYFEVRHFLTVTTSLSNGKLVSVQLPVILVHMNSLDVVPNSVAQVAAAIEEKRAEQHRHHRRRSSESRRLQHGPLRQRSVSSPARSKDIRRQRSYTQGRAFAAPRQQSLDRQRAEKADMDILRHALDSSPRKQKPHLQGLTLKKVGSNISFATIGGRSVGTESPFHAMAFRTPPSKERSATPGSGVAERVESIRARMRRVGSFDTLHSKKSIFSRPWQENARPHIRHGGSTSQTADEHAGALRTQGSDHHQAIIGPHVLGLSHSVSRQPSFEVVGIDTAAPQRPGTGQGFRERLDRSRFEFKAVRRKASGGMKDRGMGWWEQMRQKTRESNEGWI
ncbi:hypothetical protein LTR91_001237 [Friedmanniomyces endolithicus]|uniref:Arrestin C-terminal-like domain-containing protein n=1 Tax=Friedmanniomyces endolithicus TaxID=329885 RepID=A0AAN6L0L5_9PEZI|nr:hypothetical protein LTR57_001577 [Friedmanniomyces endolithicus]KAK1013641.1 hypothetical protein LTR91_001237 [Friedmanniomyces endolithicus]